MYVPAREAKRLTTKALTIVLSYQPDRLSLAEILASTFEELENCVPHVAVRVTAGTGKTLLTLAELAQWIKKRKESALPHRVLILVPTHELSGEMLRRARDDAGLDAVVFRGRDAQLPGASAKHMCADLKAVQAALRIGANVTTSVCGTADARKPHCRHRLECPWWKQIEDCKAADVLIAAHEFLYFRLPGKVGENFGLVIVDEAFWQHGLELPKQGDPRRFAVDGFVSAVKLAPGKLATGEAAELARIARKIEGASQAAWAEEVRLASASNRGVQSVPLFAEHTRKAGLTLAEVKEALRLEQRRRVDPKLRPGMSAVEWGEAVAQASVNVDLRLRRELWLALHEMFTSGGGGTGRVVIGLNRERLAATILGRRAVRPELLGLPIVHLDATMRLEVVQHYFPRMRLVVDCDVEAPHQRIVQVLGRSASGSRKKGHWSLQYLDPERTGADAEQKRRIKRLRKIETLCGVWEAGLVTHKGLLRYFGRVTLTANFNATLGLDKFRHVPALVVLGRPLPKPEDLLALSRALTGKPIRPGAAIWQDGKLFYADPALDLVHRAVTEAEVVQAIGRARGVQRKSAADSVVVWLFVSDISLPVKVDEVVRWEEIEPDIFDEMEAEGLVLESASDILKVMPQLVRDDENKIVADSTVRQWLRRARDRRGISVTLPYMKSNRGMSRKWTRVRYRPAGRGQQTRTAMFASERLATLRSTLENALGMSLAA